MDRKLLIGALMFNKKFLSLINLTAVVIFFTGCGNSTSNFNSYVPQNTVSSLSIKPAGQYSTSVRTFLSRVSNLGAKLSAEQLSEISAQRHVKPNGMFAPRPARNLSERQNLEI